MLIQPLDKRIRKAAYLQETLGRPDPGSEEKEDEVAKWVSRCGMAAVEAEMSKSDGAVGVRRNDGGAKVPTRQLEEDYDDDDDDNDDDEAHED